MAIGAITMILANVGLQIYNNWCGSRQNANLQKKREEFERAAHERNTEHMWKLLREGQELTMQLEKEKHDDRLKELQGDLDNLLKEITHEQTIVNWPLKVLPIVMKNQAFGNLLANQEENVAMHVLFARSNYNEFNKMVHPIIEKALELHCNQHWSTKSDHPILFYSGAWDTQRCPMNPNDIQITAMQAQLSNLPTLLITPFFRPNDGKLLFHINLWGVGASKNDSFNVKEIEPKSDEFHFQHLYTNKDDYEHTIGVLDWIIEDLVPYLECMIGYMADTYFWSSAGLSPHLPLLVTNGTINTDGMKYLVGDSREYYDQLLLTSEKNAKQNPFVQENLLNLYEGSAELWDKGTRDDKLESVFLTFCANKLGKDINTMALATKELALLKVEKADVDFLTRISKIFNSSAKQEIIKDLINEIQNKNPHMEFCFTASQKELQIKIRKNNKNSSQYFVFEIISSNILIGVYCDDIESIATHSCFVYFCIDSIGFDSGVFMSNTNNFKAVRIESDVFSKLLIDKTALKKLFKEKTDDFAKYIQLYDELDSKTDVSSLHHQENLFSTKSDLKQWIRSNSSIYFSGISFFKGYSTKFKKYLLLGVFREGANLQLNKSVLVSFYDTLPIEIDKLFINNTHYSLIFN